VTIEYIWISDVSDSGSRILEHCFKIHVETGSISQLVSGNWEKSLETSSVVTQMKDEKFSEVNGRGKWGSRGRTTIDK